MAARDNYTTQIKCDKCGQPGKLHLSEADYPYMTIPDREVEGVEGDFYAGMNGEVEVSITCKKCGNKWEW